MNKKQLTFYAFILTFGIACGEGSVKNFKYTTHTKNGNAPKNKNAPTKDLDKNALTKDLDKNALTKDLDKNALTKDLDKNALNYDNAINYDFTEEMYKDCFEYFQVDLKNIENTLFYLKDVENKLNKGEFKKKRIKYEKVKMMRDTCKAYFMLLIKQKGEAGAAFDKGNFKPIINFYKRVQSWLKNNNPSNYDNALNYDLTKEKDFYYSFNNDKNIIHNLVIKKRLTNEEEKIIMDNFKVLFILIRRPMIKAVEAFKEGDLEPMAKLQSLLKTF